MSQVTCDDSFDELISAAHKALVNQSVMTVRMVGDKRPYNWPLPLKRNKPAVKGEDSIQDYRVHSIVEYIEWARSDNRKAKIAKVAALHARGSRETVSDDDAQEDEDDLI